MNSKKNVQELKKKIQELESKLKDPSVYNTPEKLKQVSQEYNQAKDKLRNIEGMKELEKRIKSTKGMIENEEDPDMIKMAEKELEQLQAQKQNLEQKIRKEKHQDAELDKKNVIMEIRAGAGGDESTLFAKDLFRMYSRFAEEKGWKCKIINSHPTDIGGFKEIIFEVQGKGAYALLKNESGVHRVQRVPETEKSGRVHTSASSVVVLPKAKPVDIKINPKDLKIDTFRSSGPGGQNLQKNDTAVRITHQPTNTVVACQDERSQPQNKEKALEILRSRLLAEKQRKKREKREEKRLSHIKSGDRSEKIRTYNFPQNRLTDHRINKSWHNLEAILEGNLNNVVEKLREIELNELKD